MSILKRLLSVSVWTGVSRILGFVRDVLMARYLGAGMAADAFLVAFKLPNFFRRLFAEGAFAAAFVPLYAKRLGNNPGPEEKEAANQFAGAVLAVLLPVLLILLVVMEVGMVQVMKGLTGGFDGDVNKFDLAVQLGRTIFPYLLLISLVAYFSGILQSLDRFAAAAAAPVLLNLALIGAMLLANTGASTDPAAITPGAATTEILIAQALAIGVAVGGVLQLILVYGAAFKAGIRLRIPRPRLSKAVKELLVIMGPAAIGAGVIQLNVLIDVILAARLLPEGSVSWLFYADRLNQLPLGVIGIALSTLLLPELAKRWSSGDKPGAARYLGQALEMGMLFVVPAALALGLLAVPIIATLFERGAFTGLDTEAASGALMLYAIGLPAYVCAKILTPGYLSRGDTKTPLKFATVALVINTGLSLALIGSMAHQGIAAATAVAAWVNTGLLYRGLRKRGLYHITRASAGRLFRILIAALVMATALVFAYGEMAALFDGAFQDRVLGLATLVIGGLLVFGIMAYSLKLMPVLKAKG